VIGTSLQVQPAASILPLTLEAGGEVIDINPERGTIPDARVRRLVGPAGKLVPMLVDAAFGQG